MAMNLKYLKFIYILLFFYSCQFLEYADNEREDTQRIFLEKKKFIFQTFFYGEIKEKKKCMECNFNRYSLLIKLDSGIKNATFANLQHQPYYIYEKDSQLTISVSKELFEVANVNDIIKKDSNSNYINVHGSSFKLLNDNDRLWIPD